MPALTDLDLGYRPFRPIAQPLLDAIGQCEQLQSLRLHSFTLEFGAFARLCSAPAMRRLRHLELGSVQAQDSTQDTDECRAAFGNLAALESLHLRWVYGVDLLLPHIAHAPVLRSLAITCGAQRPTTVERYGSAVPSRELLRQLLTASQRLEVLLEAGASIDTWRDSFVYRQASALQREQLDDQWRELQRMAAETERVTIADPSYRATYGLD
jgi:hypothetical protein